jgi:hypothetical protein
MSEHAAHVGRTGRGLGASRFALSPPPLRWLAWLAIAAQPAFVASWIVAGALQPGYSHLDSGVSVLGAKDATHPWIVNTALVVLGLSIAALAPCVLALLPRRRSATVAAVLFAASGILFALIAAFPIDCDLSAHACKARFDAGELSASTDVHLWLSLAFDLVFTATPFALARALWPSPVAAGALGSGLFGLGFLVASSAVANGTAAPGGIVQRIGFIPLHLWVVIVAVAVLYALPRRTAPGVLVPVRPRDFFGRAWAGRGAVTLYPGFVWRRFPLRVEFRREARAIGDDSWAFTDTTTFANGQSFVRRMIFLMEDPDRVQVIAEDMPGGAELVLTEGGFRLRPYRWTYPLGPVGITFTCHDRVREVGDGSLDWTISFRWHGIPTGQISGRVRPVDRTPL